MSALGTGFYVDAQEDMVPRYPSAASGVEQPLICGEYGGPESCLLQSKSSLFTGAWSPSAPTYIPHAYSTSGGSSSGAVDSDGMYPRSWTLEPLSASLCLTGLPPSAAHYEIKPEPLIVGAECTALETHAPLLSDIESAATLTEIPSCESESPPAEEKKDLDPSKSPVLTMEICGILEEGALTGGAEVVWNQTLCGECVLRIKCCTRRYPLCSHFT